MKTILLAVVCTLSIVCSSLGAQSTIGLVAWTAALKQLQGVIDDTLRETDVMTSNKLEEVNARIDKLIAKMEGMQDGLEGTANSVISKTGKEVHSIIRDVNLIIKGTRKSVFNEVSKSLAVVSMMLDSVVLIDVEPYSAVILPARIDSDFAKQKIPFVIHGFFRGEVGKEITVRVAGKAADVKRTNHNGLAVAIPEGLTLKESSLLPISISIRQPTWFGLSSSTKTIDDNVYVQKKEPFSCTISLYSENPESIKKVTASKPYIVQASTQGGDHEPTVNRVIGLEQLLFGTVPDAAEKFDVQHSSIIAPGFGLNLYGACKHKGPSGTLKSWDSRSIAVDLHAPRISAHPWHETKKVRISKHPRIYINVPQQGIHDGGGTKAVATLLPTFMVRVKGVPLTKMAGDDIRKRLGWSPLEVPLDLPQDQKWSVHVQCDFEDGAEKWSSGRLVLTPTNREMIGRGVAVQIADGNLYISPTGLGSMEVEL